MSTAIPNQRGSAVLRGRPGPRTASGERAQEFARRNAEPVYNALVVALKESTVEHGIPLQSSHVAALASDVLPIIARLPYERHINVVVRSGQIDRSQVKLTTRERQVLLGMARGLTAERVGARLGITKDTVKSHLRTAYAALHARNSTHAVAICLKYGLINPAELADI